MGCAAGGDPGGQTGHAGFLVGCSQGVFGVSVSAVAHRFWACGAVRFALPSAWPPRRPGFPCCGLSGLCLPPSPAGLPILAVDSSLASWSLLQGAALGPPAVHSLLMPAQPLKAILLVSWRHCNEGFPETYGLKDLEAQV